MAKESEMRKFLFSTTRTSALTERLASPFLRGQVPSDTSTAKSSGRTGRTSSSGAPMSDRQYADAAIRFCRTLW
jgi:hypothetical protein